jgi:hypothetical protein
MTTPESRAMTGNQGLPADTRNKLSLTLLIFGGIIKPFHPVTAVQLAGNTGEQDE